MNLTFVCYVSSYLKLFLLSQIYLSLGKPIYYAFMSDFLSLWKSWLKSMFACSLSFHFITQIHSQFVEPIFVVNIASICRKLGKYGGTKLDEFSEKFQRGGGEVIFMGTFNRAFRAWNWYKRVIAGFRVCFFNNCIENNQNKTHFEEGMCMCMHFILSGPHPHTSLNLSWMPEGNL